MSSTDSTKPVNFGLALFPGFQALDVFGPVDAFNILSRTVNMNLYVLADTLDPVSTKLPGSAAVSTNFEEHVMPTHTYADAPPIDVLLVPGGQGTRAEGITTVIDYMRRVYPSLQYLITVCTASALAARAGLLDGKRATTNKLSWAQTVAWGPKVHWITHARWVVDGNIWSSSGISAGIDVAFAWIGAVHGEDVAKQIADRMEYKRELDPNEDPFADLYGLPRND